MRNNVTHAETTTARKKKEKEERAESAYSPSHCTFTKVAAGGYNSQEMGLKGWGVYEQNKPVLMLVAR